MPGWNFRYGQLSHIIARPLVKLQASPNLLNPLVLVEGKYDHAFLSKAIRLLDPKSEILVAYLELLDEHSSGGVDDVRKYL